LGKGYYFNRKIFIIIIIQNKIKLKMFEKASVIEFIWISWLDIKYIMLILVFFGFEIGLITELFQPRILQLNHFLKIIFN
jgi:hypothetical protein